MPQSYDDRPAWIALYKTAAWLRLRRWQLQREPLCRFCKRDGKLVAADTVDHVIPHKGDKALFFDRENLQSLCKSCHSSEKQREELNTITGCDEKGIVPAWQNNPKNAKTVATAQPSKPASCGKLPSASSRRPCIV